MSPIRVLDQRVADAIAAGEVVERPASVVKELVENALDAGARGVAVDVRGAGRLLVRVADDGSGIDPADLRLAFTRHATSKVGSIDDLRAISSFGFRGEALASIAAAAAVECRSRGAFIRLRAGEVLDGGAAPATPGTVVEVSDLFAGTPARLKFLKTDATETAAVTTVVRTCALLHPGVRFALTVEGRRVLQTPGDGDRRSALAAVHGGEVAAAMLEVDHDGVTGATSEPRLSRGNRDGLVLAVNGRPVSARSLLFALEEAYSGRLERGRHPVAVLDVAVDPELVDVNVHPAKREVRFRDEREVFGRLQRAVRAALAGPRVFELPAAAVASSTSSPLATLGRPEVHEAAVALAPALPAAGRSASPLRPLGQAMSGYLVAEGPEGVVLVDQHAAHERVLYNRFLALLRGRPATSQPMLVPQVVELDPRQAAALADGASQLEALGFQVESFGPSAARILAGPVETPAARLEQALLELLDTMAGRRPDARFEAAAASLACHSAVRFGDAMDPGEQRRLLDDLESAEESETCPHGRPTRMLLDAAALRRHFRRNY